MGPNRWPGAMSSSQHVYEIRPRKDRRGVGLISDARSFGALWYGEPNAINYAKSFSVAHQPFPDPSTIVLITSSYAGDEVSSAPNFPRRRPRI